MRKKSCPTVRYDPPLDLVETLHAASLPLFFIHQTLQAV